MIDSTGEFDAFRNVIPLDELYEIYALEGNDAELPFVTDYKSPNYNNRVSSIVLHHTASKTLDSVINTFMNPASGVSAHFVVAKDGTIYNMVDEDNRAWHAGISVWQSRCNLNDSSIGIEMVNTGEEPFPVEQQESVAKLCKYLTDKYDVFPHNIVAHADIAPDRKSDPSAYYNWEYLYDYLGIFEHLYESHLNDHEKAEVIIDATHPCLADKNEVLLLQAKLKRLGYPIDETGEYDKKTISVVNAFNRHFAYDSIFIKEHVDENNITVTNIHNCSWYKISEERLEKLLNFA